MNLFSEYKIRSFCCLTFPFLFSAFSSAENNCYVITKYMILKKPFRVMEFINSRSAFCSLSIFHHFSDGFQCWAKPVRISSKSISGSNSDNIMISSEWNFSNRIKVWPISSPSIGNIGSKAGLGFQPIKNDIICLAVSIESRIVMIWKPSLLNLRHSDKTNRLGRITTKFISCF